MLWWCRHGWAYFAAATLAAPAIFLRPPYPVADSGDIIRIVFAVAAAIALYVAVFPASTNMRVVCAAFGAFATSLRGLTLILDPTTAVSVKCVGASIWFTGTIYFATVPTLTRRFVSTSPGGDWWSRTH